MGFWNKLGKIALVAAPYVAAPFTGGASLAFTGAANKAASKWAQHDAKKAAEKGIAPSKFDKYLLMGANAGALATGMGAFSGGGMGGGGGVANTANTAGKISATGKQLSGWQSKLQTAGNVTSAAMGAPTYGDRGSDWQTAVAGMVGDYVANQRDRGEGETQPSRVGGFQGQLANLSTPRVPAMSAVERGRQDALRNQPFRAGYNTQVQGDDDQIITAQMPQIHPQYQEPAQSQTPVSPFMDNLTPRRMARKRNPVEEEQVYE